MGSNTQALVKRLHAGFLDSLLRKYRGYDRRRQNHTHAKKFEIGHRRILPRCWPSAHGAWASDGKTRIGFSKFPGTRNREVAFRPSARFAHLIAFNADPAPIRRAPRSLFCRAG